MPECLKRVNSVRKFRLNSKSEGTRKLANKPTRFHVENMPNSNYLLIPRVSSEKRRYVPIGFLKQNCLASDSAHITMKATLYHFGVLTSNVHMAHLRNEAAVMQAYGFDTKMTEPECVAELMKMYKELINE